MVRCNCLLVCRWFVASPSQTIFNRPFIVSQSVTTTFLSFVVSIIFVKIKFLIFPIPKMRTNFILFLSLAILSSVYGNKPVRLNITNSQSWLDCAKFSNQQTFSFFRNNFKLLEQSNWIQILSKISSRIHELLSKLIRIFFKENQGSFWLRLASATMELLKTLK